MKAQSQIRGKMKTAFTAVVLVFFLFPISIMADTVTIGDGTGTWNHPMSTYFHDARTQVIYLDSELGSAGEINSLSLDVSDIPGQTMNNFTIRMKHTGMDSYGSSPSWEGSGWTVVYQNNESIGSTGWVTFDFSTSFDYNGTDNLMVDISFNNSSYSSDGYCRVTEPGGDRALHYRTDSYFGDPLAWSGTSDPTPASSTYVPNIKLEITSSDPGDSIYIGNGTGTWNYPLSTYFHDARTQTIYRSSEVGRSGEITSLSLDVTTTPGQTMNNFTIRMKHTSLDGYGSSPSWEDSGWTTVYQTDESINSSGWATFTFSTSFNYNGSDNLMVDISFNNSSYTSDGYCRKSDLGGDRSLFYNTDSGYGDPLDWSGTSSPSPGVETSSPNVRLDFASSGSGDSDYDGKTDSFENAHSCLDPNVAEINGVFAGASISTGGWADNVFVTGNYAYLADGSSGLQIIDVSDKSSPSLVGNFSTPDSVFEAHVSGDYAYLVDYYNGFYVVDVSDPANPSQYGHYSPSESADGLYVSGNYAYLHNGAGIEIVDISVPSNPAFVGSHETPSVSRNVYPAGDYLYVADGYQGLHIIDISDPSNPVSAGGVDTPDYAWDVFVSGNYAFVGDGNNGLQTIDVSDPSNPALAGNYSTPGYVRGIYQSGDYAYVVDIHNGLYLVDITDPVNPVLTYFMEMNDIAEDVHVYGGYAYLAYQDDGMMLVELGDADTDGLSDLDEDALGTGPCDPDTDGDMMDDGFEVSHSCMDPLAGDSTEDYDSDGLANLDEWTYSTDPCNADTDGDGYSDSDEVNVFQTDPAINNADSDGDGLPDAVETDTGTYVDGSDTGTDPYSSDSDGDGMSDGDEVMNESTDPSSPDWGSVEVSATAQTGTQEGEYKVYLDGTLAYRGRYIGSISGPSDQIVINGLKNERHTVTIAGPQRFMHRAYVDVDHGNTFSINAQLKYRKWEVQTTSQAITAGGGTVAVTGGYAAPHAADPDRNGTVDLFAGTGDGKVLFYNNLSSTALDLEAAEEMTYGSTVIDVGAHAKPFAVDWNNDNCPDLLVGNSAGEVLLFEGAGDCKGTFGQGAVLVSTGDTMGGHAAPNVTDWNGDYAKDLVVGGADGRMMLYENGCSDGSPCFDRGTVMQTAKGADIDAGDFAAPLIVDMDRNGRLDMAFGRNDGTMSGCLYATTAESTFGNLKAEIFETGLYCSDGPWQSVYMDVFQVMDAGEASAPAMADVNGDSQLDLFVGSASGEIYYYPSSHMDGDLDRSAKVDGGDWILLMQSMGLCEGEEGYNPGADLNGDGCVDSSDEAVLNNNFGYTY